MTFNRPGSTRLGSFSDRLFNWANMISGPGTVPIYIPMLITAAVLNGIDQRRISGSSSYSNTGLPIYGSDSTQLGLTTSQYPSYSAGFYNSYGISNHNIHNGGNGVSLHPGHTVTNHSTYSLNYNEGYNKGYNDALEGKPEGGPFVRASSEQQSWSDGYHEGYRACRPDQWVRNQNWM